MTSLNNVATNAKNKEEMTDLVKVVQYNVQFSYHGQYLYDNGVAIEVDGWVIVSRLREDGYSEGCLKYAVSAINKVEWLTTDEAGVLNLLSLKLASHFYGTELSVEH